MQPTYPPLSAPYDSALESVVSWALQAYEVVAIVASGTIIRGTPDRRSDLDIHVLHAQPFRERVQAFHAGVPCEIFVNPPARIPRYFIEEVSDRRPMTAHMFATGVVVCDTNGVGAQLVAEAKKLTAAPPETPSPSTMAFYGAATMLEDVDDLAERDPVAAEVLLGRAVNDLIQVRLRASAGWLPRPKDGLARLKEIDSESAALAVSASCGVGLEAKLAAAHELCRRVTGHEGFFEWVSEREPA